MTEWTVTIDQRLEQPLSDDQVDELVASLTDHSAAVSVGQDSISVTMTITPRVDYAGVAVDDALGMLSAALGDGGRVVLGVVAIEAMRVDEQDRRLEQPVIPGLWGTVEVAHELGVSRQRVHQLLAEHSRFPAPLMRLGGGPLWLADTIRAFNASWERKPGRPKGATRGDGAGVYACTECGATIQASARHLPPCPSCHAGSWQVIIEGSAVGQQVDVG